MSADRPTRVTPSGAGTRRSLIIAVAVSALALGLCAWLIVTDPPAYRFVVRMYEDKQVKPNHWPKTQPPRRPGPPPRIGATITCRAWAAMKTTGPKTPHRPNIACIKF